MSVNVNLLHGGNGFLVKFQPPFDVLNDLENARSEIMRYSEAFRSLTYLVVDISDVSIQFADVVQGMAGISKLVDKIACSDSPSKIQPLLVGNGELLKLATESFAQDQYGNLSVPAFTDLETAMKFTRGEIAEIFK